MGSTVSALIEGDDLRVVRVRGGLGGARAESAGVVEGALGAGGLERARAAFARAGGGRLVLTVPSDWAAVRAIPMTCAQWRDGVDEIRRSVGGLLPLTSEDAMLGLIESPAAGAGEAGGVGGGYLVGVSAAQVRPWVALIERASGRRVDAVLTRHMAMLGLGLQEFEHAGVLEMMEGDGWGVGALHRLSHGLVERLGEAWGPGDDPGEHAVVIGPAPEGVRARTIGGDELAVGAALARAVAGHSFVPLDASPARAWGKWAAPVGALAAAGLLFAGGGVWYEARLAGASARVDARMAQISAEVDAAGAARAEALETMALIDSARGAAEDARGKMLPALVAALESVPTGGFVYRLEVSRDRLSMQGEAGRAGDVVRAIENSGAYEAARLVSPVTASRVSGNEMFDVTAAREGGSR